ncbi:hypothetical protein Ciccas_007258 [Cichlidogyrus casuarinus]|uniref:Uncharacterized protein n=1 Tax=Cichlidogyrus casuarinus TaxID=1844966 RepID=A0ABD2Q416_9PLAT
MCWERLFHRLGAAIQKALSPLSFLLDLGTSRSSLSADLRDLGVSKDAEAQRDIQAANGVKPGWQLCALFYEFWLKVVQQHFGPAADEREDAD